MTVIEFIGFVISLAAMAFLFIKKIWDDRQKRLHPHEYAEKVEKREKILRDFMKSINSDQDQTINSSRLQKVQRSPVEKQASNGRIFPKKQSHEQTKSKNSISNHQSKPSSTSSSPFNVSHKDPYRDRIEEKNLSKQFRAGETTAYDIINVRRSSLASKVIRGLPSSRDLIIIKEVFGPPKSMQGDFEIKL